MSRSQRLLQLLQLLRSHRFAVPGAVLAEQLGVSLRTVYRDIATLQQQGATIEGEAGLGYVLRPGFMLPPLMFSDEEIEALVLGVRWVAKQPDTCLSEAASSALTKISAVLPQTLRNVLESSALLVGPNTTAQAGEDHLALLRHAIRSEHKVTIIYHSLKEQRSTRTIWPFALGYFEQVRVLVAWCELRQAMRHFRTDRILSCDVHREHYPQRRQLLLNAWFQAEKISAPS